MAATSSGMCSSTSEAITRSKVPSANGRRQGVALDRAGPGRGRIQLAGVDHGAEGVPHAGHLVGAGVEGHHRGAPAGGLEGVAPEPAAEVEQAVAGPHTQPVVVDGQHRSPAPAGAVTGAAPPAAAGSPGSGRPASSAW